jgi:death-on-curing protein
MVEPNWLRRQVLIDLHSESLRLFGGPEGIRDEGMLDSALDRPRNRFAYEPDSTLAELAAAYAFGLARNHPFVDGNKRAAFLAIGLFLGKNGVRLTAPQVDATVTILSLASGELSEAELAAWIEKHTTPI